jgi:hypothetical protein
VVDPEAATADGPARKRTSWSIKTIVEDIAGVPIAELQDPDRPVHPYLKATAEYGPSAAELMPAGPESLEGTTSEEPYDPVARVYPPLAGRTGRELHGRDHEHHAETLERHRHDPEALSPGTRAHLPGPSRRPERIYLHYLLLHLDRLGDAALRYLKHAVDEELSHREG